MASTYIKLPKVSGSVPAGTYVLIAGDIMTGQLGLPSWKLINGSNELTADWDGSSTWNLTTSQVLSLNASVANVTSFGGGVYLSEGLAGGSVAIDNAGNLSTSTGGGGSITETSAFGVTRYFGANGGDYSIVNNLYGTAVITAETGGRLVFSSLQGNGIVLSNDPNTGNLRTQVNNGFNIVDDSGNPSASLLGLADRNISFGKDTFSNGISGGASGNIGIGGGVFEQPLEGSNNIGIGTDVFKSGALTSTAIGNIGVGTSVLGSLTEGESNIGIGTNVMALLTSGDGNLAVGTSALQKVTTGSGNTAIGLTAGFSTDTGTNNTFIGVAAGAQNTSGAGNLYMGASAGANVNGNGNIAIGPGSMVGASGSTASANIAIGLNLLSSLSSGANNIVIGDGTGGAGVITTGDRNLSIGYGSDVPSGTADNQMSIGNAIYGLGISSSTGTTVSDAYLGVGVKAPTARLHLRAGAATASQGPLKFTSGTNLTTAENGTMEYNGTNLFFTRTGAVRESVLIGNSGATAPGTSVGAAIVNYYGSSATNFLGTPNSWASVVIGGTTYKIPLYT